MDQGRSRGFSLLEVLVVMSLLLLLVVAAISAITLLDRSSRRQAQHTTALEVAQGKLDEILARPYNPPSPPFTSTNHRESSGVTLTVDRAGTKSTTLAAVTALVEPVANGHVATVFVEYTNYNQPTTVRLQTLINKHSGGQR